MGTAIGLVVGLALGIFISVIFNFSAQSGIGINNQVQVSGTVQQGQSGSIKFSNLNSHIASSAPIANGRTLSCL